MSKMGRPRRTARGSDSPAVTKAKQIKKKYSPLKPLRARRALLASAAAVYSQLVPKSTRTNEADSTFKQTTTSVSTDPLLTEQNTPEIAVCFGGFAPESNVVSIAVYAIGVLVSVLIILLLVYALKHLTARPARPIALLGTSPYSLSMGGNPALGSGNHKGDNIYIWEEFDKGGNPANGNIYIQDDGCGKGGNHLEGSDLHKGDNLYTQEDYDQDQSRKCLLALGPEFGN